MGAWGERRARTRALSAYVTPGRCSITDLISDYRAITSQLYQELLNRIDDICEIRSLPTHLWEEEDATLDASEAALTTGEVTIDEVVDIDIAVYQPVSLITASGVRIIRACESACSQVVVTVLG